MTISKRLLALLMALAMCFALAACKSGEAAPSDSAAPSESPSESAEPSESPAIEADLTKTMYEFASGLKDGDTAVTVNGTAIPNELFFYWLSYDCYYMASYYGQFGMSADFSNQDTADYLINDVQTAITYYAVLRQLCEKEGVTVTDEQLADLQSQIDQAVEENFNGSLDDLLRSYGLSEESFRYVNTNGYLFTNYAEKVIGEPTAADLEQYVTDSGIFSVKHILLKTVTEDVTDDDGNVTQTADEYNTAQKAKAEDLLAQLQKAGDLEALFDELMNEHSEDGRDSDGNLAAPDGYTFDSQDSLVGGFREAALELKSGELSGIVETDYGYHIMLRLPVDASSFRDDWVTDRTDAAIAAAMENAEVTLADDVAGMDVAAFYERYMAYGMALYNQENTDK